MKKLCLLLIFFALFFEISAQTDSTSKLRFSGIQIGLNFMLSGGYRTLSLQDHQKFIKNDPTLHEDFSGFYDSGFEGFNSFGGFALRLFAELPGTNRNKEISIGVMAGGTQVSYLSYTRRQTEVVDMYIGQQFKDTLYRIKETTDYYGFSVDNTIIYIPIGIQKTTNKKRLLWGSAGLEIAPGFAKYTYYSSKIRSVREATIDRATPESYYFYYPNYMSSHEGSNYQESLDAIGFSGYLALPFSANLHFSKGIKVLRNVNLCAQAAPILLYSKSRYTPSTLNGGINTQIGVRLAW